MEEVKREVAELEQRCSAREMEVTEHGYPFFFRHGQPGALRETPLRAEHERLGAMMGEHHGWLVPLHYGNAEEELKAAQTERGPL